MEERIITTRQSLFIKEWAFDMRNGIWGKLYLTKN
jgi:hypothetical protein